MEQHVATHSTHSRRETSEKGYSKIHIVGQKTTKTTQAQKTTPKEQHTFYPTVINNANIPFSNSLLHKGLKYNINAKKNDWIHALALASETAINQLPTNERDVCRKLVADCIDTLQRQNPTHRTQLEEKVIK
jgi:hypothetical protein